MQTYINKLDMLLQTHNVCKSHGIEHAIAVLNHAKNAICSSPDPIEQYQFAIELSALLHDADDKKFFPMNNNYENTRLILKDLDDEIVELVIRMISLVSASVNGDSVPEDVVENKWMLIPRYSDRLEAIGVIGIRRAYVYNCTIKCKTFDELTPKLTSDDEIIKLAKLRYQTYNGNSRTMIDHLYDKLIAVGLANDIISNDYLTITARERVQPF